MSIEDAKKYFKLQQGLQTSVIADYIRLIVARHGLTRKSYVKRYLKDLLINIEIYDDGFNDLFKETYKELLNMNDIIEIKAKSDTITRYHTIFHQQEVNLDHDFADDVDDLTLLVPNPLIRVRIGERAFLWGCSTDEQIRTCSSPDKIMGIIRWADNDIEAISLEDWFVSRKCSTLDVLQLWESKKNEVTKHGNNISINDSTYVILSKAGKFFGKFKEKGKEGRYQKLSLGPEDYLLGIFDSGRGMKPQIFDNRVKENCKVKDLLDFDEFYWCLLGQSASKGKNEICRFSKEKLVIQRTSPLPMHFKSMLEHFCESKDGWTYTFHSVQEIEDILDIFTKYGKIETEAF